MDYKMEILALLLCVVPNLVTTITITSNGNSPEIKMTGGMMMGMENDFVPMMVEASTNKPVKSKPKNTNNVTTLSINERYRRLIPYMTFYYANDLATPNVDNGKAVEVAKAQLVDAGGIGYSEREPKKIVYTNRNIPLYQGNRLTQHNIASANPNTLFYKIGGSVYQAPNKATQNFRPPVPEYNFLIPNDFEPARPIHKPVAKTPHVIFISQTRKPFLNLHHEDNPNIRYYLSEKDQSPKYKLVPYEQTPPVKVPEKEHIYEMNKPLPVSVLIPKEQKHFKQRPVRPQYVYEEISVPQPPPRKQPATVANLFYEKQHPFGFSEPNIEGGFKPIFKSPQYNSGEKRYTTPQPSKLITSIGYEKHRTPPVPVVAIDDLGPTFYEYIIEQNTAQPPRATTANNIPFATILNSFQFNKPIAKSKIKEHASSSFTSLLQVLNALKSVPQYNDVEVPVLSTPKPVLIPRIVEVSVKPTIEIQQVTEQPQFVKDEDLQEEPYLAHVNAPSQHIDEVPSDGASIQQFPLPLTSDDDGGTPGRPGVDYPIMTVIPPTKFDCKTQRYKGFFADPETRCQVWHYCDLNGGQASFLCPNGTIFSQAGLTCDWWFNVRCNTTTQLYVLNESLYKYILPHSPKFPEDYSGPLVDKYLTLKFKEMEEQFKKNKNKHSSAEKDSQEDDSDESVENSTDSNSPSEDTFDNSGTLVSETEEKPSVIVESPGTSGNVERLQDE